MKIYHYDPVTGLFMGAGLADQDPLDALNFLVPAHATVTEPPELNEAQVAVFADGRWSAIPDVRGTWYNADREAVQIDIFNADVSGLTRDEPPSAEHDLIDGQWLFNAVLAAENLAKFRAEAQARIDAYFEQLYAKSVANSAIGAEYDAAYIVAKEWLKDTTKPAPDRIKALAESYSVTNAQAAQVVVAKWTEAQAIAFDLRGAARLRAKLAIRKAVDAAGVAAAEAAGRSAMEAVVFSV